MFELISQPVAKGIAKMSDTEINEVRKLESFAMSLPQTSVKTSHVLHGGMYIRSMTLPEGNVLTGALIKIPTILIIQGDAIVYKDGGAIEMRGYNVLPASANRKQAILALTDVNMSMFFPTNAKSVEEAEEQFTDETNLLGSHASNNEIIITGE